MPARTRQVGKVVRMQYVVQTQSDVHFQWATELEVPSYRMARQYAKRLKAVGYTVRIVNRDSGVTHFL